MKFQYNGYILITNFFNYIPFVYININESMKSLKREGKFVINL